METGYDQLWDRANSVPAGREQIAVLEELVRLADANGDVHTAYHARREVTTESIAHGFPEKAIVAFSWCLAQLDKDEELDDPDSLIWQYKTIIEMIPVFSRVTRQQIVSMQEDMAKRLQKQGESERTAHYYRSWNFMRMGDYETALEYQNTYTQMRRSDSSDCSACERDRQVELLSRMQQDTEALKLAAPILSGQMRCSEVPEFTNAHIVRSLLRLNRVDEAKERHDVGYDSVRRERKYLGTIGDLMLVQVRVRDFDTGINQMIRHLPWAADTSADELRMRFYSACSLLLEALSGHDPRPRKLRLPKELPCWHEDETYDPAELAQWFAVQTQSMVKDFDKRNGNNTYDRILEENRVLCGL